MLSELKEKSQIVFQLNTTFESNQKPIGFPKSVLDALVFFCFNVCPPNFDRNAILCPFFHCTNRKLCAKQKKMCEFSLDKIMNGNYGYEKK